MNNDANAELIDAATEKMTHGQDLLTSRIRSQQYQIEGLDWQCNDRSETIERQGARLKEQAAKIKELEQEIKSQHRRDAEARGRPCDCNQCEQDCAMCGREHKIEIDALLEKLRNRPDHIRTGSEGQHDC